MTSLSDLPVLTTHPDDAVVHVRYGEQDYKKPLSDFAGSIFYKRVVLTAADILGMNPGTPKELIAAPGAGFAIQLFDPIFELKWLPGNTAWSLGGASGNLILNHPSNGASYKWQAQSSYYTATDVRRRNMSVDEALDIIENEAIQAFFGTQAPISGDSEIVLHLHYRILEL